MKKEEWFERESFWNNFGPVMFDSNRWAEAPAVAEAVVKLAGLKKGNSVLDAGCGPGRISVELALLGLKVTGVDIIQSELDAAKESADDENVELELVRADLREFDAKKQFDCAVNLFTSFGYCDKISDDIKILKNIYNHLKPGGTFILECLSLETAILYFTEGEWFERAGKFVLTEFSVTGAWEGLRSKWTLIDKKTGERIEHEYVQRLYPAAVLKNHLLEIGYSEVNVWGGFDKSPYNEKAGTMVIAAKK